jgi:hypothetical protein
MPKLFEKDENGLLHEVPADQADALRATRRFTHSATTIEILFTEEEEAARNAEEQAAQQAADAAVAERAASASRRQAVAMRLGLSEDDMKDLGLGD